MDGAERLTKVEVIARVGDGCVDLVRGVLSRVATDIGDSLTFEWW